MRTSAQLDIGTSQHVTLSTDTGPIAGLRAGRDGDPAVLLVPGYTGSKEDFGPLLDPLATAGFSARRRSTCQASSSRPVRTTRPPTSGGRSWSWSGTWQWPGASVDGPALVGHLWAASSHGLR